MTTEELTLAKIKKAVRKLDPDCKPESEAFKAAVCLLASLQVGPNAKKIAEFTKYRERTVRNFAGHLRDSGVWRNGKVRCEWFDERHGGVAFWLDVAVATGMVRRA